MKQKTLLLFQLLLLIFTFYVLVNYSGTQRIVVSLTCLITVLLIGRVEASLTERHESVIDTERGTNDTIHTTSQALSCLLKSKNVLLLTDAIQHLLRDMGLAVSPSPDHPSIDRLVILPHTQFTCGMKIVSDVEELNENWNTWEELSGFDHGKGGKQRLLLIGGNSIHGNGDHRGNYTTFSLTTQELLFARKVVAMTTLTLGKIYLACKKKKLDIRAIFHAIQHHPGGVFQIEH